MGALMNGAGELAMGVVEKIKVLNAFFVSAFTNKTGVQEYPGPWDQRESLEQRHLSLIGGELG